MQVHNVEAKSLIRHYKKIDSWFISKYGMNLYRGCIHNCAYCDGRTEKYQVDGIFGEDIQVKINAIELLKKELKLQRLQKFYQNGYILIGGGVGDSYQPVEKTYKLTQKTLQFLDSRRLPVHILTKSTLVKRDIDILKSINKKTKALISFSFSSTNDKLSNIFEPGSSPPSERLKTIKELKQNGLFCGMFLLPVIPFITDSADIMKQTINDGYEAGVDFIVFGGMTLKNGRQKTCFYELLKENFPDLIPNYEMIYQKNKWGNATDAYYQSINQTFNSIMKHYYLPKSIPPSLFNDIVSENDRVIIILDQLQHLLSLKGKQAPYGFAAYNISKLDQNILTMKNKLQTIKGVGRVTEKIILEILEKKTSIYYEKLLTN